MLFNMLTSTIDDIMFALPICILMMHKSKHTMILTCTYKCSYWRILFVVTIACNVHTNPLSCGLGSSPLRRGLRMYSTRATAIQQTAIKRMLLEPPWVLCRPPGTTKAPYNHVNTHTTEKCCLQYISWPCLGLQIWSEIFTVSCVYLYPPYKQYFILYHRFG
jgi:hypothetical protein